MCRFAPPVVVEVEASRSPLGWRVREALRIEVLKREESFVFTTNPVVFVASVSRACPCTPVAYELAYSEAVEAALGIKVPESSRSIRRFLLGLEFVKYTVKQAIEECEGAGSWLGNFVRRAFLAQAFGRRRSRISDLPREAVASARRRLWGVYRAILEIFETICGDNAFPTVIVPGGTRAKPTAISYQKVESVVKALTDPEIKALLEIVGLGASADWALRLLEHLPPTLKEVAVPKRLSGSGLGERSVLGPRGRLKVRVRVEEGKLVRLDILAPSEKEGVILRGLEGLYLRDIGDYLRRVNFCPVEKAYLEAVKDAFGKKGVPRP